MSEEDNNILRYNQKEEAIKIPFTIYADIELLDALFIIDYQQLFIITQCSFDNNKSKHNYYGKRYYGRGKDYMKKLCEDLRKNLTEISKHDKKIISQTRVIPCMQKRV